jgi:hypothetical protein
MFHGMQLNTFQQLNTVKVQPNFKEELYHILPVSNFKDKPYLCWCWINIRPVSKELNRSKRDNVDYNLFIEQLKLAYYFLDTCQFVPSTFVP